MTKDVEGQFDELANTFIEEAEEVDCDKSDFARGLEMIVERMQERISAVRDEIGEG